MSLNPKFPTVNGLQKIVLHPSRQNAFSGIMNIVDLISEFYGCLNCGNIRSTQNEIDRFRSALKRLNPEARMTGMQTPLPETKQLGWRWKMGHKRPGKLPG